MLKFREVRPVKIAGHTLHVTGMTWAESRAMDTENMTEEACRVISEHTYEDDRATALAFSSGTEVAESLTVGQIRELSEAIMDLSRGEEAAAGRFRDDGEGEDRGATPAPDGAGVQHAT